MAAVRKTSRMMRRILRPLRNLRKVYENQADRRLMNLHMVAHYEMAHNMWWALRFECCRNVAIINNSLNDELTRRKNSMLK